MGDIMKKKSERLKQKLLGKLTHNLGEVVVKDDRIICYVNAEKIGLFKSKITLGMHFLPKQGDIKKYNLDKPIYFIFNHINFYDRVWLYCPIEEYNIVFKNCDFKREIHIEQTKNVTFQNNSHYIRSGNQPYLCGDVENLKIIQEYFWWLGELDTKYSIDLKVKNLEIKDSVFNIDEGWSCMRIKANKIDMLDSFIKVYNEIEIYTDKLSLDNSYIESQTKIILNDKNNYNNMIYGIESPNTIYNGINLSALNLANSTNKQKLREILLQQLKTLKSNIEQTNIKEIIELNKRR